MSTKTNPIKRALISVSDKSELISFASSLHELGVELISTGGTSKAIAEAGLPVKDVSDITGFPEIMDGRVKTLHPKIHGGLLAIRANAEHQSAQETHDIDNIDLLVVNLYPFEETLAKGAARDECIENIDIGGPAMIRAAAKNHQDVTVVVDVDDYERVIAEMKENDAGTSLRLKQELAAKAYARTSAYDAAISNWFADDLSIETPKYRTFGGTLKQELRYGENPHQRAAFYITDTERAGVANAQQIQGKELSYNNINDTDAAFECVSEFGADTPAIAIIKHANPCGVAVGTDLSDAYKKALRCDPVSAFGGIIASNQKIDLALAELISDIFTEVIIAPDVDEDAKALFAKKKNLRLLLTGGLPDPKSVGLTAKTVSSGMLVQSRDNGCVDDLDLKVVTKRAPSNEELEDLKFAFRVCKHVKSNTIIYAKDLATVGIGAGQMSRLDSSRIAARKSADAAEAEGLKEPLAVGSVVASDAFFPFADGLLSAAEAGATAIIQPGGSIRDEEVIAAADEKNLAMVFTGMRHFKH